MPSHTKGAGPSHWSRVGARVLDPPIDFWKKTGCPKWTTCFVWKGLEKWVGGEKEPVDNSTGSLWRGCFLFCGSQLDDSY